MFKKRQKIPSGTILHWVGNCWKCNGSGKRHHARLDNGVVVEEWDVDCSMCGGTGKFDYLDVEA